VRLFVGDEVGALDGDEVGRFEEILLGDDVRLSVEDDVGALDGDEVGRFEEI